MAVLELVDFLGVPGLALSQSARDAVSKAAHFRERGDAIRAVAGALEATWAVSAAIGKEAKDASTQVQYGLQSDLVKHLREVLGNELARWSEEYAAPDKAEQYAKLESAASWALVGAQAPESLSISIEDFGGAAIVLQPPADLAGNGIASSKWSVVMM